MFQSGLPWSPLPLPFPQRPPEEQVTDEEAVPEITPPPSSPCPSLPPPPPHSLEKQQGFVLSCSLRMNQGQTGTDGDRQQIMKETLLWTRHKQEWQRFQRQTGCRDFYFERLLLLLFCKQLLLFLCFPWWVAGFLFFYSNKRPTFCLSSCFTSSFSRSFGSFLSFCSVFRIKRAADSARDFQFFFHKTNKNKNLFCKR